MHMHIQVREAVTVELVRHENKVRALARCTCTLHVQAQASWSKHLENSLVVFRCGSATNKCGPLHVPRLPVDIASSIALQIFRQYL